MPYVQQPDGDSYVQQPDGDSWEGTRAELILDAVVPDLVGAFLPLGEIESAIEAGELTIDDIVERFRAELVEVLK
jgi:hypothetical protein